MFQVTWLLYLRENTRSNNYSRKLFVLHNNVQLNCVENARRNNFLKSKKRLSNAQS